MSLWRRLQQRVLEPVVGVEEGVEHDIEYEVETQSVLHSDIHKAEYPDQCVLYLSEDHEIVVEAVRDVVKDAKIALEERTMSSRVLSKSVITSASNVGVEIAPVVIDAVLVVIEVLPASLDVVATVRIPRHSVRASKMPVSVTQVTLQHLDEVLAEVLKGEWKCLVASKLGK